MHQSSSTPTQTLLLRRVQQVQQVTQDTVTLSVDALPGVQLGVMPGWLTGEPLEAQGV